MFALLATPQIINFCYKFSLKIIIPKNVKFLYECDVISNIVNIKKIKLKYVNIFFLNIFKILSFVFIFTLFDFPCFIFSSTSLCVKPFIDSIIFLPFIVTQMYFSPMIYYNTFFGNCLLISS